jgi:molybdate transport system regulatory protein
MVRLTIRIDFDAADGFGPGKARLLELVAAKGSIRKAAAAMEMSYRQAWLLLASVERTFGAPVITTATGGAHGGGAKLSELGMSILSRYRMMEKGAQAAVSEDLSAFARTAGRKVSRRRGGKSRRKRLPRGGGT